MSEVSVDKRMNGGRSRFILHYFPWLLVNFLGIFLSSCSSTTQPVFPLSDSQSHLWKLLSVNTVLFRWSEDKRQLIIVKRIAELGDDMLWGTRRWKSDSWLIKYTFLRLFLNQHTWKIPSLTLLVVMIRRSTNKNFPPFNSFLFFFFFFQFKPIYKQ